MEPALRPNTGYNYRVKVAVLAYENRATRPVTCGFGWLSPKRIYPGKPGETPGSLRILGPL
jgi:hypothetical protein